MALADSVSADKTCYQLEEHIRINFNKDVDSNFLGNWVAIYSLDNLQNLENLPPFPAMWVWTCGTQSCNTLQNNRRAEGTITFGKSAQGESQKWPLGAGLYFAALSGGDRPYSAHAVSDPFEIGCPDEPTVTPPSGTPRADSVSVVKTCYEQNEPIGVNFSKDVDSNLVGNWVAIYRQEDLQNLEDLPSSPAIWVWTCGSQSCSTSSNMLAEGIVTFEKNSQGEESRNWPLSAGLYFAVLTGGVRPYSAHAISDPFEIGCNGTPFPDEPTVTPPPGTEGMAAVIEQARDDIESLIRNNRSLTGKFLRLSYHDCVGGCDGE